jgi:hypothetical protein
VNNSTKTVNEGKWLVVLSSVLLLLAFFFPWVSWGQRNVIGSDLATGNFFRISEKEFGLANPFPQFSFATAVLWLIPAFALISAILALGNKKVTTTASIAGVLALGAATLYVLFSNLLGDLGIQHSLQIGIYITFVAGAGIILASSQRWLPKIIVLILGPVLIYAGFSIGKSAKENEKFDATANSSSDYTVSAADLLREFQASDSTANAKYREKILTVNGNVSTIESSNDSTANLKFVDSTGSYAIFTFLGPEAGAIKKIKEGESVSVKGACSGSVFSEILGIHAISFKRCTLNK